jgi:prepilin-type N-terminal cleavage/methylation domain-containing protein
MKKGFTLVELLVVVTVVMLLSVIAIGMYFNSLRTFTYFSNFKNIQSVFRQARSFAISNASIGAESPERFGVFFTDEEEFYRIFIFADRGEKYLYEEGIDTIYLTKDYLIPKSKFDIIVSEANKETPQDYFKFPMAFYYEKSTGSFKAFSATEGDNPKATQSIEKSASNFIDILIVSKENDLLKRHLVINQVSGLAEEYKRLE